MQLASFAFGMLAMMVIIFLVVIVVGFVKVIKVEKELGIQQRNYEEYYRSVEESLAAVRKRSDELYDSGLREAQKYTDSRIDKSIRTGSGHGAV